MANTLLGEILQAGGNTHIQDIDPEVSGYAIAEFTEHQLTWKVYRVDKTRYETLDDGRDVSAKDAPIELCKTATYDPTLIDLDD